MIQQVTTATARTRTAWILTMALAALAVSAIMATVAVSPYLFKGATMEGEVARQVSATTGLVITRRGSARFELLPHPHLAMQHVHIADPSGTLTVDAESLNGEVRLLPLLVGRLELSSATLVKPNLVIDLDGRPMGADSTIGRALRTSEPIKTSQRLGTVALVDGSAVLKGRLFPHAPSFTAINVTVDWRDLDSPATLTGSTIVQTVFTDIAAWIADPSALIRGERSQVSLRLQSIPIDVTATGDLANNSSTTFRGRLVVTAPSLPSLLALGGYKTAVPAPFANLALKSDATIGIDHDSQTSFDLQGLRLRLDGNDYEGSLAFQGGAKPSLSATLATERLALAPFFRHVPTLVAADGTWSGASVALDHADPIDLDLRISATHVRLPPVLIDDAAIAVMTRYDRTEIALVEGTAYGGAIKGRLSIGKKGDGALNLRASGSLADADASTLSWDVCGRQVAAGALSAAATLESSGDSTAALMAHLQGWAKGHVNDGELSGVDLGRNLREIERKDAGSALLATTGGRTPFKTLAFSTRIVDGIAAIDEGVIQGLDAGVTVTGDADIGRRGLALKAIATAPAPSAAVIQLDVSGSFDKIVIKPDTSSARPAP